MPKPVRRHVPPQKPKISMTDRQSQAWELTRVGGLTQEQAGVIMGISQRSVGRLIARIRLVVFTQQLTRSATQRDGDFFQGL